MTAITADNTVFMATKTSTPGGMFMNYEVAATTVIYKNSFVGLNATGYLTSYVAPAVYTGATATGTAFVGIAQEHITSQTSDGDARCAVQVDGYFDYTLTSTDRVDIGTPVFASDNATLVMVGTSGNFIGHIVGFPGTNLATVKLAGVGAQWAGHFLSVVSPELDFPTVGEKILLVHETWNPNGLICCTMAGYTTEAHVAQTTQGIITMQHTADTTMDVTLLVVDNSADKDVIVGAGGLWNPASASDGAIVFAPAGKQINAEVTTASNESGSETGKCKIFATFMSL